MNLHPDYLRRLSELSPIPAILVGILLLFLGRKLFWLFVAAVGFVLGAEFATAAFPDQPTWALIAGIVLGIIGAVVAIFVQKVAIGAAGFLAGGYFLMAVLRAWSLQAPDSLWISFVIGGAFGAFLMLVVFDWALIVFSSVGGAHLITHSLVLAPSVATLAFVILVIVGIVAQANLRGRRTSEEG